jgi:membrane dipeptidase
MTSRLSRRDALKATLHVAAAVMSAPMINIGRFRLFAYTGAQYSERAIRLVRESLVIDMLGLLTLNFPLMAKWTRNPETLTPVDIQKFKDSGINVFHTAVGTGGQNAHESTMRFVSGWNSFLAGQDQNFMRIDSPADFDRVKTSGKVGILIGVQNSEHFRSVEDVELFHGLGQRVSQLTYNSRNLIGNGATERRDEGISDFGVAVVERMNKTGMAVDVSHCGDRTTLDAFEISKKPVLITHSNCRTLVPGHPRLKTDEAIKRVGTAGSIMGITGVRMFVKADDHRKRPRPFRSCEKADWT